VLSDPFEIIDPQGRFKLETRCTLHCTPLCIHCGASASLQSLSSSVDCTGCGKPVNYVPLERDFKGMIVTHVCATELDGEAAGATPVDLPEKATPIAMACPLCSANLQVTADSARTISCEYCNGSIFLPDALWRRFHPVKTVKRWATAHQATAEAFHAKAKDTAFSTPLRFVLIAAVIGGGIFCADVWDSGMTIRGWELASIIGVGFIATLLFWGTFILRSRRYFAAARRFR
jgi:DNA-directed RNA polymerase subunit RPC12/RpoP